ncbi:MAG: hypothetical protein IKW30_02035 [Lachnospiraceae bacterium]|nr:hypothetical protein [Lachnospiraceae bacterium]
MEENKIPIPFFMTREYDRIMDEIYRDDKSAENQAKEKEKKDREYFKQMYPEELKKYLKIIIEILNRLEGKDSFIYDEFPDKIRIERLTEIILKNIPLEKNQTRAAQRNIIKLLLWEEIVRRRNPAEQ